MSELSASSKKARIFHLEFDHFLAEVRDAILRDGGKSFAESRHFLDSLDLRGYNLGAHLGTGSAGAVFAAIDPTGNEVAIKVLPLPEGESATKIFQREVKIGQTIEYSSIVKILHAFELGPAQFVVMELVKGSTLKTVLNGEPLELKWFFRIFEPLAEGLEVAHSEGVVHRDLKPDNWPATVRLRFWISGWLVCWRMQV